MLKPYIARNLLSWIKNHRAPPTQISISPTNFCNLYCQSCWRRDKEHHQELNVEEEIISDWRMLELIQEAIKLKAMAIELTGGGEPLIRGITPRLIEEIKKAKMMGWMTSNGTLFTPDLVRLFVEAGWDKLTISLDGPDEKTNDFLRPPGGTFNKIINTLSLFQEHKAKLQKSLPEITFHTVISKYNIDKLYGIVEVAHRFGVKGLTFEPVKELSGHCGELMIDFQRMYHVIEKNLKKASVIAYEKDIYSNIGSLLSNPDLVKYSGKMVQVFSPAYEQMREYGLLNVPCFEPWFHMAIQPDGSVHPCCMSAGLENVNGKSLEDIWFGDKFSSFRKAIVSGSYPSECNKCNANLISFSDEIKGILGNKLSVREKDIEKNKSNYFTKEKSAIEGGKRLRVIITDTAPLYPPLWGGPRRIWNLYSGFSPESFDITYVGISSNLKREHKYSFNRLSANIKEILCGFPPHYYIWHKIESVLFKNTSLDLFVYLGVYTDWHFRHVLDSQKAQIVIISHPWSSPCIPRKENGQLFIYDAHNCEYLLMDQILGKHPLKGFVLHWVKKIEANACGKSDLVLVCSDKEKEDFRRLYRVPQEKLFVVPNGTTPAVEVTMESKMAFTWADRFGRRRKSGCVYWGVL